MENNDKYREFISVEFDDLNDRYGKMDGVNTLSDLVSDKWGVKEYIVLELIKHAEKLKNSANEESPLEVSEAKDKYFFELIEKLSTELLRRGHNDDAENVEMLAALVDEKHHSVSEVNILKQREYRIKEFLRLGVYKTNAKTLSLAVEKLVLQLDI